MFLLAGKEQMENKYAKGLRLLLMLEAGSQATGSKHSKTEGKRYLPLVP